MADNKLSVRRVEGVVDGTVAATLSQLLRLTSDAVIVLIWRAWFFSPMRRPKAYLLR